MQVSVTSASMVDAFWGRSCSEHGEIKMLKSKMKKTRTKEGSLEVSGRVGAWLLLRGETCRGLQRGKWNRGWHSYLGGKWQCPAVNPTDFPL